MDASAISPAQPVPTPHAGGCDVLVVGGGVAGLTAAALIAGERPDLSVLVVEAAEHAGGQVRTTVEAGYTVEHGATALTTNRLRTLEIVARAGLGERLERAAPGSRSSFVCFRGALHPVPRTPRALAASRLLSWRGKLRVLAEPVAARRPDGRAEETVYEFVARRFGHEAARIGAMAALQGVTAGDATATSLAAVWPRVHTLDRRVGRRGLIGHAVKARRRAPSAGPCTLSRGGLQALTDALAETLGERLRCGAAVQELRRSAGDRFAVTLAHGEAIEAGHVIVALPAAAAAPLLGPLVSAPPPPPGAPMRVIGLGYPSAAFREPPRGLGFLAAPGETDGVIGAIVSSNLFPGQAPADRVLVRAFLGGAFAPHVADEPRHAAIARVERVLSRLYRLRGDPQLAWDFPWPDGIPQYPRGHMARIRALERALAAHPRLHVARNALAGVGLEDAIEAGATAARDVIEQATPGAIA